MCGIQCTISVSGSAGSCTCAASALLGPNLGRRGPDAQQTVHITPPASDKASDESRGVHIAMASSVLQLRGASTTAAVQTDEEGNALCYNGPSRHAVHLHLFVIHLRPQFGASLERTATSSRAQSMTDASSCVKGKYMLAWIWAVVEVTRWP